MKLLNAPAIRIAGERIDGVRWRLRHDRRVEHPVDRFRSARSILFARITTSAPRAFFCGPTAAWFWDLLPVEFFLPLWVGVPAKARRPVGFKGVRFCYFSGRRQYEYLLRESLATVPIFVSDPARAVCELFSKRNFLGEKIPRIALRAFYAQGNTWFDLAAAARVFKLSLPPPQETPADDVKLTDADFAEYEMKMNSWFLKPRKRA